MKRDKSSLPLRGKSRFKHSDAESKWRREWEKSKVYSPRLMEAKKPFYNLMMFPYLSAEGLHVGNMYAFTGADVYGRYNRMIGYDVFEPIGLDGFGIHSENYAIKVGRHPMEHAKISEKNFYNQLRSIGDGFAWDHRLETYDPDYYRWTQWLFIQMHKAGLAYKDVASVNWCPKDKTVLADEQVIDGCCERCGTKVERREMSSWFFKITKYAERLLTNLDTISWPEKIKTAQRQWIGKSDGMEIEFMISDSDEAIRVFTTRPDTLNGVTFLVLSPERAQNYIKIIPNEHREAVEIYIKESLKRSEQERKLGEKEKTGVVTGLFVKNPFDGSQVPVFVADYVLADVGTGAIMGVPAHDERDRDFARKHKVNIIKKEPDSSLWGKIEKYGWGQRITNYHIRDWLISRQRYWGPPIPMVYCEKCGYQSVPESELPVKLPHIDDFKPKGDGTSPLSNAAESWKKTTCPNCGGEAVRELDVSDTFLDSSWYFLAYPNLGTKEWKDGPNPFNEELTKKWLPVNAYIGGAEHAVLHLLYARFVTMVLHDLGYLGFEEPFPFLFGHGLIIKDGAKMSKSKGNVVIPDEYIKKFGADTLRCYLMFLGQYEQGGDFRDTGMEGMRRFIDRVWDLFINYNDVVLVSEGDSRDVLVKMHQTVQKVTKDIQTFGFNTSIASIMEFVNLLRDKIGGDIKRAKGGVRCAEWDEALRVLAKLIAPFAPHMAEEVWVNALGEKFSIHQSAWPKYNPDFVKSNEVTVVVQVDGKVRGQITLENKKGEVKSDVEKLATADPKVSKWLENKKVREVIFVPGKIINFVTKA